MSLSITKEVYLGAAKPSGGGTPINNEDISVTSNGIYTAGVGYTGLGTVDVNVPNPSTGTLNISANDTYDVTNYASAVVNVPTTAPAYYVEKTKDANNKLVNGSSSVINLSGVEDVGTYVLYYAYYGNTAISGSVDLSSLKTISGTYAFYYTFYQCTGITSVDLSSLTEVKGSGACQNMFAYCTGITSVDLSSLKTATNSSACLNMFTGVGITSITLPSLESAPHQSCFDAMFSRSSLTGFSLPALATITGQQACQSMFSTCPNLTSATFPSLFMITGRQGCYRMFYNCSGLTTASFPKLYKLTTQSNLSQTFYGCSALSTLSISLPYTTTNLNDAFTNMLQGCSNVTVHFPAEWQTDMASWANVTAGFGGTNTTVLFDLPNVTALDLTAIKEIVLINYGSFANNNYFPNITSVDLSELTLINSTSSATNMFNGCGSISSINVSSLVEIGSLANSACQYMFKGTAITSAILSSLKIVNGYNCCQYMFQDCTSLTSLSFPALKTLGNTTMFTNMLNGTTNVTAHFPSNMSSSGITASTLSGTGTTVLFDLPATNILTGADTKEYERNPKYDTGTALAWRINGTMPNTTTYYTSGLTDPTVGTTIYSDSACTIAETTVSSIA